MLPSQITAPRLSTIRFHRAQVVSTCVFGVNVGEALLIFHGSFAISKHEGIGADRVWTLSSFMTYQCCSVGLHKPGQSVLGMLTVVLLSSLAPPDLMQVQDTLGKAW